MFVITNRAILESKQGLSQFGDVPSEQGPNELRIVEATKRGDAWKVEVVPDVLPADMKREVGITRRGKAYGSEYVARKIQARINRNVLLYVHGFNNDMGDVLEQAERLRRLYRTEVLAFSWPARGGGAVSGTLSYRRDKKVALVSVGALDRTIAKIQGFLAQFNQELLDAIIAKASSEHPQNAEARDVMIAEQSDRLCPYRVSAMFHSMGNYLFKHALLSSTYESRQTIFDNIVLAAADTNNEEHARWVDQINVRRRIYVTINEDDYALRASRIKIGEQQQARLGHFVRGLNARRATYVDFTGLDEVGNSHSYFLGPAAQSTAIKDFFTRAFRGEIAESVLWYHASGNIYRFWRGD